MRSLNTLQTASATLVCADAGEVHRFAVKAGVDTTPLHGAEDAVRKREQRISRRVPMNFVRKTRWMLLALLLSLVPASSFAGVLISVGFAPPVLPVYEQPPCPEAGWMWTPGYWAYGDDGYYWVPGAWVPAPYEGALWTPPYWGWSSGIYVFHPGYWGRHIGYYGGVNYGFGYMGIGFVGGEWHGHDFRYNTAVVRVDNVHVRNVYIDRTVVQRNTIVNDRHVAYSGGPGGIRHEPAPFERQAMHEQHMGATSVQQAHFQAARSDRSFYARNNGGHPQTMAAERPMGFNNNHGAQSNMRQQQGSFNNDHGNVQRGVQNRPQYQNQPSRQPQFQNQQQRQPQYENRQQPRQFQQPQERGNYQQPRNESRPAPQPRMESRPAPQPRVESRPAPQHEQSRPQPQHEEPRDRKH
jgi:hypothetical protein